MIDPIDGKLSIIKYMLFSIGLIYVLYKSLIDIYLIVGTRQILLFIVSIGIFVALWGILQYLTFHSPIHRLITYDYLNLRPSAFFSETTWYSEYIFFSCVLLIYISLQENNIKFLLLSLPCFLGILISATRNTYIAIAVWGLLGSLFLSAEKKINKKIVRYFILTAILLLLLGINGSIFQSIINRFNEIPENNYRIIAFEKSLDIINEEPIWGHGFSFDGTNFNGTFIGAKNFNFFLMVLHTIGYFGFLLLLMLLFHTYSKIGKLYLTTKRFESKISIVFLTSFLSMSMFAPIHQFPIGMFVIALALSLMEYTHLSLMNRKQNA